MDSTRIAIYENGLHPKAKYLYSILHAYAGADGVAVVKESLVTRIMKISPARLRGYRSELNASGYCRIVLSGESLIFQMASDHPARESDHPARSDSEQNKPSDHPARESDHPARADSEQNKPSDHPARESDHPARDIARGARAGGDNRGGRLVGINYLPIPGKNLLPTNQPVTPEPKLAAWEAAASEGLLLAVGCESLSAIRSTAQGHPFETIRAHALAWQRDTKTTGPGGLLNRIRSGQFAAPELSDDDRRSSLFLRHRTPAEIADAKRIEAEIAENDRRWEERQAALRAELSATRPAQPAPSAPQPQPETMDRDAKTLEIWQITLNELALSMPTPTFETWLKGTTALGYTDGEFVVGVSDAYARDWLKQRLLPQIKRILGRLCQRSVEVTFTVRPRPGQGRPV
jgi:hypothetical protein